MNGVSTVDDEGNAAVVDSGGERSEPVQRKIPTHPHLLIQRSSDFLILNKSFTLLIPSLPLRWRVLFGAWRAPTRADERGFGLIQPTGNIRKKGQTRMGEGIASEA